MNILINGLTLVTNTFFPSAGAIELTQLKPQDTKIATIAKEIGLTDLCNLTGLKEELLSCPHAKSRWDEVEATGPITIKCVNEKEAPGGAMVWLESREILLAKTNDQMLNGLLFELNNLHRAEMALLISKRKCGLGVELYATTTEAVEYGTVKDTHKITEQCAQEGYWPTHTSQYADEFSGTGPRDWTTMPGYLETQEKYGHTDFYRKHWFEKCNPEGLEAWQDANKEKWDAILAEIDATEHEL